MILGRILMKVSVQDITATEMVKDVEMGNTLCFLFLFTFSNVGRILECHKLVDFSGLVRGILTIVCN